ncbi:hypothetical protein OIU76_006237 [Salix suchowensis]|nr:hypothetical protein OIU76_006237 [Salix suchowensis]
MRIQYRKAEKGAAKVSNPTGKSYETISKTRTRPEFRGVGAVTRDGIIVARRLWVSRVHVFIVHEKESTKYSNDTIPIMRGGFLAKIGTSVRQKDSFAEQFGHVEEFSDHKTRFIVRKPQFP